VFVCFSYSQMLAHTTSSLTPDTRHLKPRSLFSSTSPESPSFLEERKTRVRSRESECWDSEVRTVLVCFSYSQMSARATCSLSPDTRHPLTLFPEPIHPLIRPPISRLARGQPRTGRGPRNSLRRRNPSGSAGMHKLCQTNKLVISAPGRQKRLLKPRSPGATLPACPTSIVCLSR
jgi:hypothetical protein